MTKRVYELRDQLSWSTEDTHHATSLLDDGTAVYDAHHGYSVSRLTNTLFFNF